MQFDYTVRTQLREDIKLLIPALRKRLKIKIKNCKFSNPLLRQITKLKFTMLDNKIMHQRSQIIRPCFHAELSDFKWLPGR